MGSTLTNGIYLPAEGERNCYEGLAANWTALDGLIGGYNAHIGNATIHVTAEDKEAWNGKADASALTAHTGDTTIHVTAEDKAKWDAVTGKADASALTAHTGDTTIHVTAADKQAWNGHVADTDIHVTTTDKNRWNNQTYVFRYSSTALTASSTNSNTLLDNTDNLKVGDKVIDSSGVLFSITAIDTANSTFTIGTALIDLAQDSDVVHKSGNETIAGTKTFTSLIKGYNSDSTQNTVSIDLRSSKATRGNTQDGSDTFGIGFRDKYNGALMSINCIKRPAGTTTEYHTVNTLDNSDNVISVSYSFNLSKEGTSSLQPEGDNQTSFGSSSKRWKEVYAQSYYYGANNVEFSQKFVTTDTNQTISGNKTFSSINGVEPSSLSLPSGNLNDIIDISSYLTHLDGTANTYTAPANGWISITMSGCSGIQAYINGLWGHQIVRPTVGGVRFLMPILKDKTANILIFNGSIDNARFIPCQGNV